MIQIGKKAPAFKLKDQNGTVHSLKDYAGKKVLLYFYPKDDTSGCTTEACNFRDGYKDFKKNGLVIFGVSADSVASHKRFAEKFTLPFPLLADEDKKVVQAYGVWQKKKMYGREYEGIVRRSFLIDEAGKIAKIYEKVKPAVHAGEVLSDVS
ncbi:thioredoxin-dependent thiol peroxidase [Candidatus Parcubacteria bacterium]|uniref:thioredoxin-dependent peroxiredoxin n=1 Tax=Candidatus Kaiserbacteria bacterium CG10_big_fil_rev_8_21_14_0_10_47_16 TaxID=1974608 RepID=A0A2H0UDE3_9BACT|nr:thioredoxin-dependent thiol peroxidase [Candidatus Parcubacteria bacterium]PIR84448.1 MAG: thioredoxin-dependent thiol peroxidase [Candidatus Kaiserbacteria bacterium CG10_big_fil_rev_8_21_14_0_10_47_16]